MDGIGFNIDFEGNRILEDVQINGQFKTNKSIRLDGMIQGCVQTDKCIIVNQSGLIEGDVRCDELYLNGTITGNVCVTHKTTLGATAVIKGGLITDTLEITPGATIQKGLKLQKSTPQKQ